MARIESDSDWYEMEGNAFDSLVAEAKVGYLQEQLEQARKEIELLTEERDMALLRIDELEMKWPAT